MRGSVGGILDLWHFRFLVVGEKKWKIYGEVCE
jgi:hypothetical protein